MDIPANYIEGEIGMFAYEISTAVSKDIDLRSNSQKRKETLIDLKIIRKLSVTIEVPFDEIIIPTTFSEPHPIKMKRKLEEYRKTFDLSGISVYSENGKLTLWDGYTKYLIAKSEGITCLFVDISIEPMKI